MNENIDLTKILKDCPKGTKFYSPICGEVDFKEIGWLFDTNKADKLCDSVVLDALEEELTDYYGLPHKGGIWSRQRQNFMEYLTCGMNK